MSYDLSKDLLKLWWLRNTLIISLITSLALTLSIYLAKYDNKVLISATTLLLSIETLVSMRNVLRKFYEVLNIVGASRRVLTLMITLNTLLSIIPLYLVSTVSFPTPMSILIVFVVILMNYLLARRKI